MREPWNFHTDRPRWTDVSSPFRRARAMTALVAVTALVALPACTPEQRPPTSPPSSTPGTSVTGSPDASDTRGRLAAGLQGSSPANARLVSDAKTTLTPVEASWLPGWQIFDVQNQTPPHPRRVFVALSDTGEAVVLTGQPDAFSAMLKQAGVALSSADVAAQVAAVFHDSTRTYTTLAYRIDEADDIRWLPTLTAEQQKARDAVVSTYGDRIAPPKAEQSASGWTVEVWTISGADLVRHETTIGTDGTVTDETETVASDLPVPASR